MNLTENKECIILKNKNVQIFSVDNFLSEEDRMEILFDSKNYLKTNKFIKYNFPHLQSDPYLISNYIHKNSWKNFVELISILKDSFYREYYKTSDILNAHLKRSWVVSMSGKNVSPNHWHRHKSIISGVYYLQSPEPKISTLFKCDDGSIVSVNSKLNRLILFPGDIVHTPDSDSFKSSGERITLSFDICTS